ncbi:ABC transporter substrate-binding protein [Nocardia sp. NPDC051030]|uniref:ABC transporter substrate-binding protein n=1 Tax=Nocardia sp. NPDC051030 TaxID=3155162 RepID=UPI0034424924
MTWKRRASRMRAALALLLIASAAVAGCSSTSDSATASETRAVQTDRGSVTVPSDPKRIVVVNGALAGYLYDLGAPVTAADPRLLGVSGRSGDFPPAWAEDAKRQGTQVLPVGDKINLEFIASQHPDLILGGGQGYPAQQSIDAYDQLSAIAPTVLVSATTTNWQDQLRAVADAVGRGDRVDTLLNAYRDKVKQVKSTIKPPAGSVAYFQSQKSQQPTLVLPTATLPTLLAEVGIVADDKVLAKAGNPSRNEAADWFQFSPELLTAVVDAPVLFVLTLDGGRTATQLATDPMYAKLPAFQQNKVFELPASSQRPDYRGVMSTLDLMAERFQ